MDDNQDGMMFHFSVKRWRDHIIGACRHWMIAATYALTALGGCWLLIEVASYFVDLKLHGWTYLFVLLFSASVVGIGGACLAYWNECPDGLEGESPEIARLAHLKPAMWEFRVARLTIQSGLSSVDGEFKSLLANRVYVAARKCPDVEDYWTWIQTRPKNVLRMVDVAMQLLRTDLAHAMRSTPDKHAAPKEIVQIAHHIASLYRQAFEFERESREIIPPDGFERVHNLQDGWSTCIRGPIQNYLCFLEQMEQIDPDAEQHVSHCVKFDGPPNIDEMCEEIDACTQRIERGETAWN